MKKFPKTIGVTGGIGSGKSYICHVFTTIGYPVFYADAQAKKLLVTNQIVRNEIIKTFGTKAYQENGELDRKYLAEVVFKNPEKRTAINEIVHPAVRTAFHNWVASQNSPYVFQKTAILFETGGYKNLDFTLLITADLETKIDRVMKRDQVSQEQVIERINAQMSDKEKIPLADFVIDNSKGKMIFPQIKTFFKEILHENI